MPVWPAPVSMRRCSVGEKRRSDAPVRSGQELFVRAGDKVALADGPARTCREMPGASGRAAWDFAAVGMSSLCESRRRGHRARCRWTAEEGTRAKVSPWVGGPGGFGGVAHRGRLCRWMVGSGVGRPAAGLPFPLPQGGRRGREASATLDEACCAAVSRGAGRPANALSADRDAARNTGGPTSSFGGFVRRSFGFAGSVDRRSRKLSLLNRFALVDRCDAGASGRLSVR